MTTSVNLNRPEKADFLAKARAAWPQTPAWVEQLAAEANRTSVTAVAKRINYSVGAASQVIGNKYPGDLGKVEAAVRGALMGETVICPVLDEIGRDWCLKQQDMPRTGASAIRGRVYQACRSGCPHSRIKAGDAGQGGEDAHDDVA